MRKILYLIIILFIYLRQGGLCAQEIELTPDEAIAIALRDNRDMLLKSEDVKEARYKINEAWASVYPSLNVTGSASRLQEYYSKDFTQKTAQVTVKQILYQGGKIVNTINYNKDGLAAAQAILDKTKLETALSVKKAFYTLLLANEFVRLNKGILDNTQEHLQFLRARYSSGQASQQDILQIEASLNNVTQAYEASLNQVESSQALLNNLLYLDKDVKIVPNTSFAYTPREVAFDEAFLSAMKKRPEISQYEAQIEQAKKNVEIQKAGTRPTVYASWDYYTRSHAVTGTQRNWNDHNIIGITASWPVFDGFATRAKVDQALVDLKAARLNKEKSISDIRLELQNAYVSLKDAVAKLPAVESDIVYYNDNLAGIRQKYARGIASSLDVSDADLQYNIALFNRNEAIYNYIVAKSSFDKAAGGV